MEDQAEAAEAHFKCFPYRKSGGHNRPPALYPANFPRWPKPGHGSGERARSHLRSFFTAEMRNWISSPQACSVVRLTRDLLKYWVPGSAPENPDSERFGVQPGYPGFSPGPQEFPTFRQHCSRS